MFSGNCSRGEKEIVASKVMPGLASEAACANPMELPDGKIGRLLIYESGKVQLRVPLLYFLCRGCCRHRMALRFL